jgi:hypothetical protein
LRGLALLRGVRGALKIVSGLFQLLSLLGHARLVFRALHSLPQVISIREHLLLLLFEALQLAPDLFTLLFRARFLQGGLKFLEAIVDILLPLGQLLKAVHDLQLLAALGAQRRAGLALTLVTLFGIGQIELFELTLHLLLAAALVPLPVPAAADGVLAFLQFQQGLVGGLLGRDRFLKRGGRIARGSQLIQRPLHLTGRGVPESGASWIALALFGVLGLVERLSLGVADDAEVVG